jgi:hypothetical protein
MLHALKASLEDQVRRRARFCKKLAGKADTWLRVHPILGLGSEHLLVPLAE